MNTTANATTVGAPSALAQIEAQYPGIVAHYSTDSRGYVIQRVSKRSLFGARSRVFRFIHFAEGEANTVGRFEGSLKLALQGATAHSDSYTSNYYWQPWGDALYAAAKAVGPSESHLISPMIREAFPEASYADVSELSRKIAGLIASE